MSRLASQLAASAALLLVLLAGLATRAEGAPGDIATVAGTGLAGDAGDGGPATAGQLRTPQNVAFDPSSGAIYVADTGNDKVRRIDPDGTITTVAGTGVAGFAGDGGPAVLAVLRGPRGVAVGAYGAVFIADTGNDRIRRIDPDGTIATYAGTGLAGSSGDGGPATAARINAPHGMVVAADGSLYFADNANNRVRRVDPGGSIGTVAGTTAGYAGDGGPATAARLDHPAGVALDAAGVLYIADRGNHAVRRVALDGTITTVAGTGVAGFNGDGILATSSRLATPSDVAIGPTGALYIADSNNHRIRVVGPDGTIATFAGTGTGGYTGDGGPAVAARLRHPTGILVAAGVNFLIADENNHVVRAVSTLCGDGIQQSDEVCDLGSENGAPTSCCTSECGFRASGATCRAQDGACDAAESCTGASATCGVDLVLGAGSTCRPAVAVCDEVETCDGVTKACPEDSFVAAGTTCRAPAGDCDVAEACTGTAPACPADVLAPATQTCRVSAGVCDPAESCTGTSDACPPDLLSPSGTSCRDAVGVCDATEVCSGSGVSCPSDAKRSTSFVCRPSTGACDPAETCDGASDLCPGQLPFPDADLDDVCDAEDNCFPLANPGQEDGDTDGVGDACDNCPAVCNPDQADTDQDSAGGDACDACPAVDQAAQAPECAGAGPGSTASCCLPAASGARPVDQEGDACAGGGAATMVSTDGSGSAALASHAARIPPLSASGPTTLAATALSAGALPLGAAGVVASAALFTPEEMSFASPLTLCMRWRDEDGNGSTDGSEIAATDLRPALVGTAPGFSTIAGRCGDHACGGLDAQGFPDDWGSSENVRSDDDSLRACCDLETRAWCFEAVSLGTHALVDTPCVAASRANLRAGGLDRPPGSQSLVADGKAEILSPESPPLDPVANGMLLRVVKATGESALELRLPPGAYDSVAQQGWTTSRRGTSAKWRSVAGYQGIRLVKLKWGTRSSPAEVSFKVKGRGVALSLDPALDLPLRAELRFDDPAALSGLCASLVFPPPPASLGCIAPTDARLVCRH